ncbi:MAG: hypothetical protein ABFD08_15315, partial [Syntrophomonas sp.]
MENTISLSRTHRHTYVLLRNTIKVAVKGVPGKIHIPVPLPSRDVHVARPLELARLRWAFLPCFANICFHIYASLIRKPGVFQGEL